MKRHQPSYAVVDGFRIPASFCADRLRSGLSYRAEPDDLFIVTYPKCGTTWTQHIVWLIKHDGVPLPANKSMTVEIPHLEEVGREVVVALPKPRVIKAHLPYNMTPYHPEAKYIYVTRNPLDCAVSFFHHTRGFPKHYDFAEGTFDDYFECFLAGEVDFGDYFENLLSWYPHRNDENVLFLRYEQMKADTRGAILAIAKFMGDPAAERIQSPDLLQAVLEHSSFRQMHRNQGRWSSKRPAAMPAFLRKGKVGDWRTLFSSEQANRLMAKFDKCTEGTEITTWWAEVLP